MLFDLFMPTLILDNLSFLLNNIAILVSNLLLFDNSLILVTILNNISLCFECIASIDISPNIHNISLYFDYVSLLIFSYVNVYDFSSAIFV